MTRVPMLKFSQLSILMKKKKKARIEKQIKKPKNHKNQQIIQDFPLPYFFPRCPSSDCTGAFRQNRCHGILPETISARN